jgi:hypothetical protein
VQCGTSPLYQRPLSSSTKNQNAQVKEGCVDSVDPQQSNNTQSTLQPNNTSPVQPRASKYPTVRKDQTAFLIASASKVLESWTNEPPHLCRFICESGLAWFVDREKLCILRYKLCASLLSSQNAFISSPEMVSRAALRG